MRLGNPRRRLRVSLLALAFVLFLFVGRLVQLQGLEASEYARVAQTNRLEHRELPATRGAITDRHGYPLATTVPGVAVTANPRLVENPAYTASALAPLLELDRSALFGQLSDRSRQFTYLAKQVEPEVWREIENLELPGISHEQQSKRVYPAGSLAANVVGFVQYDYAARRLVGGGGLEYALNDVLAGHDGTVRYESVGGARIPAAGSEEEWPVPGQDARLTLDRDIQWVAEQAIAEQVRKSGARSGTVVAMDPASGDILALATVPSYDPNNPGAAPAEQRGNRALAEIYEPGSTSKIMTLAAAIEEGVAEPDTRVVVPGQIRRSDATFNDHVEHGTWQLTLTGVLAKSSNIGTILVAEKLGWVQLYRYLRLFGVGDATGLDFPGESKGILPPPEKWSGTQGYTIAFGQGLAVNAVQATSVFATIAAGGVRAEPRLVESLVDADGEHPAPESEKVRVVSPETARAVSDMMESVVSDEGTAPMARIPGYRVAGKTGTAERYDSECTCYRGYTASFIGFAPADDPALVVSVTLQDPVKGHSGGQLGGPVFKRVMSFGLQTLEVPPTGSDPPSLPVEW